MGKKLVSWAVNLLCAAAILLSLAVGWTAISTPKGEAPSIGGWTMLTVLTGSMEPALPQLSLLLVRETPAEEIGPGDIITFYARIAGQDGLINTHRVVEVVEEAGGRAFRTQGDANQTSDPVLVTEEALIGRVVFHSYALGVAVSALRTPPVFLALVLVPLLVIIFASVRRIVRLGREEVARAERELKEGGHDNEG